MRYALLSVAMLAWGLWVGATVGVFVFGWYFQRDLPHDTFRAAANAMFGVFRFYQLGLAAAAIAVTGVAFVTFPSRWTLAMLAGFIACGVTAIIFGLALLPMMDNLRRQAMVDTDAWRQLHGQSMATLALQALVLIATGGAIVGAVVRVPRPRATIGTRRFEAVPVG